MKAKEEVKALRVLLKAMIEQADCLKAQLSSERACAKEAREVADYFRQFVYSANGQQRSI
jgi:hypothetical protein